MQKVLITAAVVLAAAIAAQADWTYTYTNDFSTQGTGSYDHSIFWPENAFPPPDAHLVRAMRGPMPETLMFYRADVGYGGAPAYLAYRFPLVSGGPQQVSGTMGLDVTYFTGGVLSYSVSSDGMTWASPVSLLAGHQTLTLASSQGACYVKLLGDGAAIDNLSVQLVPEPGSLMLLALGGVALLRRRK
jgi:hypothetical protein